MNQNKSIKTQISIVKSLLDGSSKSQRQIAKEINREESTVSKALGYLSKAKVVVITPDVIQSGYKNKGMYKNNLCRLSYDLDKNDGFNILKFLRNFLDPKTLKPLDYDLDNVFNVLIFFKNVLNSQTLNQSEVEDIIATLQKYDKIIDLAYGFFLWKGDEIYEDWGGLALIFHEQYPYMIRDMFRLSGSFLENFLRYESFPFSFERICQDIYAREDKDYELQYGKEKTTINGIPVVTVNMIIDFDTITLEAFRYSVINDIIHGFSNLEALKLIKMLQERYYLDLKN